VVMAAPFPGDAGESAFLNRRFSWPQQGRIDRSRVRKIDHRPRAPPAARRRDRWSGRTGLESAAVVEIDSMDHAIAIQRIG